MAMGLPQRAVLVAAMLVVIGASPSAAGEVTDVAVGGPPDWRPDPGYELHMLGESWRITAENGGGVANAEAGQPFPVTLYSLADCSIVVRFTAEPGDEYEIVFPEDGPPFVEGGAQGPLMRASAPTCDELPDSSAVSLPPDSTPPTGWLVVTLAGLAGLIVGARRFLWDSTRRLEGRGGPTDPR